MATTSIVVTGDLLKDYHLVRHITLPKGYGAPVEKTLQYEQPGGAWFLHDMVQLALKDLLTAKSCSLLGPKREGLGDDAPVGNAHSVWSVFPRRKNDKNQVWRIADFLGCGASVDLHEAKSVRLVGGEPESKLPAASTIVVLDDIGLGFRSHEELWPRAIRSNGAPRDIVLKTNCISRDNLLLQHLLDQFADQLTLVIGAVDLRARGAAISKGLSWDRTIEETAREFEEGLSSCDIARARRVIVHFEGGAGAASFTRMRRKLGPLKPESDADVPVRERVRFERFLYLPDEGEGVWAAEHPGKMFGTASIMTASVVRHLIEPAAYPLFIALGRGLAAARYNSERAGGGISNSQPSIDMDGIHCRLNWSPKDFHDGDQMTREQWQQVAEHEANWPTADPCSDYYTAFPHEVLTDSQWRAQPATESNLLRDAVGRSLEYYAAVAMDVVIRGPERGLLRSVPKARYGNYMTVDREEIERINALRELIETYRKSASDKRPLSIAVFGPPGSGKSFAIKQLAAAMFGKGQQTLEFNLSQFADGGIAELHEAFHLVRDASIKGAIPLVFWDEFDADDLQWLKQFLAPMQDAEFRTGSGSHPFGKAIFVFAGGTKSNFQAFDRSNDKDRGVKEYFAGKKGPDFISRLRGFVNIKGPNPSEPPSGNSETAPESDPEHLIRRAMILRSLLERSYGHLFDPETKFAKVSARVVRAFLRVERFLHGARSMESLLSMSNLRGATAFDVAELTTPELMGLHVTPDFISIAERAEIENEITEALSKAFHKGWREMREQKGWKYAAERDDDKQLHNLLKDFEELTDDEKRKNYDPAIVTPAKLAELGYRIQRRCGPTSVTPVSWPEDEFLRLLEIEHDVWVRSHMLQGYEYAEETDYDLRRHRDIAVFGDVPSEDQDLDAANIREIAATLAEYGYELVKE